MLREYNSAIAAAVERVMAAERKARTKIVSVAKPPRETRFTTIFLTLLEEELNGFSDGGITWSVYTDEPDKQSGGERDTGFDMIVSLDLDIAGARVLKGFQAQAKVNRGFGGLSVNDPDGLVDQCDVMLSNSPESFVFVYGDGGTSVLPAISVVPVRARGLSHLASRSLQDFFTDFFTCWVGDRHLGARSHPELQKKTRDLAARRRAYISGRSTDGDAPTRGRKPPMSPEPRRFRLKRPS